jgi:cellulose synthase/poly-beta-1,6-N-acetylglucosamine synthase-like glycosyltransferase
VDLGFGAVLLELALLSVPTLMLVFFSFFAVYNYAHAFAAFSPRRPVPVPPPPGARVAVVIVSFNERTVIADTVRACEQLSYPHKTIIVGDDSKDPETIELLRALAAERGCERRPPFVHAGTEIELWESEQFVVFHRADNIGFKAGNLKALEGYLLEQGYDYMYLLDADWRPQVDTLQRCLEVIHAEPTTAYVQTKRLYHYGPRDHFQRCLAINEEACYLVDMPGRQRLRQMILFTGCCTLFDMRKLAAVGGFLAGHLTEDIDLSNRFYLAGHTGVYLEDVANVGEVPPNYKAFRRQQERWAIGSARTFKEYFLPVLRSDLPLHIKLSLLRQNSYFTVALGVEISLGWSVLAVGVVTLDGLLGGHSGDPGALLRVAGAVIAPVLLLALFSNVLPLLVGVLKKREWLNLLYIPAASWIALSVVHTYAIANIKGFRNVAQTWFVTPKTNRQKGAVKVRGARWVRALNLVTLLLLVATYVSAYGSSSGGSTALALVGIYALLWMPSMIIATLLS